MERSLLHESAPVTEGPCPEGLDDFDALMRQHQPRIFRFLLASLRDRDAAENLTQDLYVSPPLKTKRVMIKDEDVCLHCGLCAERCPTGAWDMQKFLLDMAQATGGKQCRHG